MYAIEREESLLESQGEDADCERIFDRRWALATLDETIRRCERHFLQGDRRAHWLAFERRILQPAWTNRAAPKYAELARDLGFSTLAHARAAVQVVRRRFDLILRQVVAETTDAPAEAEDEYRLIMTLLS